MATRVLIHVSADAGPEPLTAVQSVLHAAGAEAARRSHPELPGVWTASVPEGASLDRVLTDLRAVPGVRHVEIDQLRTTF